jgi:hypothetical protein
MLIRILLIVISTLLFLSCSVDENSVSVGKPDSDRSSNQALAWEDKNTNDLPVEVFGTFSNRDSNGEHEWGYEVDLWSHDGILIGMFTGSAGTRLVGDPPTGILRDVMYNYETGIISFRATLPNNEYVFEGMLSEKRLSGKLFDIRRPLSELCAEAEKLVLLRSRELTAEMEEYPSLDAWKERMAELVRFRGVEGTVR